MATKFEEGAVVITSNQTAGRGQRGNTWESEPGANLTFSLLLKPHLLKATDQFLLTVIISIAITDSLRELEPEINFTIKWPNDILGNQKKVCGMLIENSIGQSSIQQSIVGMGININQQAFSASKATSLSILTGKIYDLNRTLNVVLEKIEKRYLQLRNGKFAELKMEYLNRLFGRDEWRNFLVGENHVKGKILDVDELGRLIVEVNGKTLPFNNKEITFLLD